MLLCSMCPAKGDMCTSETAWRLENWSVGGYIVSQCRVDCLVGLVLLHAQTGQPARLQNKAIRRSRCFSAARRNLMRKQVHLQALLGMVDVSVVSGALPSTPSQGGLKWTRRASRRPALARYNSRITLDRASILKMATYTSRSKRSSLPESLWIALMFTHTWSVKMTCR